MVRTLGSHLSVVQVSACVNYERGLPQLSYTRSAVCGTLTSELMMLLNHA